MSDWQVGDLAACVDERFNPHYMVNAACVDERFNPHYMVNPLKRGSIYRIAFVGPVAGNAIFGPGVGLELEDVYCPAPFGFSEHRFRKIRPDEREACEPEFVTLLQRIKKPQEAPVTAQEAAGE